MNASGSIGPTCRRGRPAALAALARLEGRITADEMAAMNARAKIDRVPEDRVAAEFLAAKFGIESKSSLGDASERLLRRWASISRWSSISLAAAILVAIPLGIVAARRPRLGTVILGRGRRDPDDPVAGACWSS